MLSYIEKRREKIEKSLCKKKCFSQKELIQQVQAWRQAKPDLSVVFTNGCFDILHMGHVRYLQDARKHGDKLIVGLNSDESLRRLKGPPHPLQEETSRMEVLAALSCVDAVTLFHEDTPLHLIQKINPHVLVKGGDWALEQVVGADWVQKQGGKVRLIPYISGHSTSKIIRKILDSQS